jgi:phytoene dehydrogenase-like protein
VAFLLRAAEDTAAEFERLAVGDGETWLRLLETVPVRERLALELSRSEFGLSAAIRLLVGGARAGALGLAELSAGMVESARDWLERGFGSPAVRGLLAPWALHAGMGPDAAGSGFATRLITLGKQRAGSPLPRGGGSRLVEALVLLIERHGGAVELGVDVERILVHAGKARGVVAAGGRVVPVRRAVICNVTPTQLYGRLLADPPAAIAAAARGYRYGLADLQIHYALSDPPRWYGDARLDSTAVVHVTGGIDGVSRAVNEGQRGLLPAEPTLVVGQPLTVDASRAPAGAGMLWVQVVELPWRVRGDAANELDCGGGEWTPTLRERYVERVHDRLARHIGNLDSVTIARTALSPADLAAMNINLVHGDPYSGAGTLDQSLIWRPFPRGSRHRTPVDGLWHIGASTHPGPGLSGTSGYLVGRTLLSRRRSRR